MIKAVMNKTNQTMESNPIPNHLISLNLVPPNNLSKMWSSQKNKTYKCK